MRAIRLSPLFLAAVCLSAPLTLTAQYENGSVVGTVRDSSGAAIAAATVTVTNRATGIVSTRQSDDQGNFEVPALRVGQYDVKIEKEGFAAANATNITILVAARQRVDLTLGVGSTATSVEVSDVALGVETDTSQRGETVTQHQTVSLPLVSRNFSDLVGLAPGVRATANGVQTTSNTGLVREGSFNVNGQRSMFNNYLLDGMDNNAYGESNQGFSNEIIPTIPDSVAAFQIVTNNASAEYGRGAGATINVASAQGTNTLHGRVYEFIRNTDLNAVGFFAPAGGRKPQFNRNQFGGNVGGRIVRDHAFFFLDYEGLRQSRKQISSATLPTPNQLAGRFSKTVYDPYNSTAYAAGTSILTSPNVSPIARTIAGFIGQLNPTSATSANFTTLQRSTNKGDKGDLRLDYTFNPRNSVFVRASQLKTNAIDFPGLGLPLDGASNGYQRILDQQLAGGYTRVIGANQLLDVRVGVSKTKAGKFSTSIGTNPGFTFAGLPTDPAVAGGIPGIGITGFSALGRQTTNPQFQNPAIFNPKVNYSWIRGKHSLKFGYEYQKVWMDVQDTNPLYGGFTFGGGYSRFQNGVAQGTATSDNYVADFLWGASSIYSLSSYFVAKLRTVAHFGYVQDDWKVTPKLTVNVGLRYEYASPYSDATNRLTNFDPTSAGAQTGSISSFIPASDSNKYGFSPDKNNFAPRFGFAYSPDGKTSVRGGFGISFAHYDRAGSGNVLGINPPFALFTNASQTAPSAGGSAATFVRFDSGFPSSTLTFNPVTANPSYIDGTKYRDSYVESYYLSVQRQLAKNTVLDIAYVGNHGLKLLQLANFNQKDPSKAMARPLPAFGDITYPIRQAYSHYDSIQVKYEQQMVAGLTLLNSFTYGHALDNAGASLESATPAPQDVRNLAADYGNSDYNQPLYNTTSLVYDLPFGRGQRFMNGNGFIDAVLGQWQVSAINQASSGFQFNITDTPVANLQVTASSVPSFRGGNIYRPNRVRAGALYTLDKSRLNAGRTTLQYLNPSVLSVPTSGSPFGNLARNSGRSPSINYLNLALNKRFSTPAERLKVEFRSELYNVLNRTNFATPGAGLAAATTPNDASCSTSSPVAGCSPTGGTITSTLDPRIVQFGLKIIF
jgi:hypothetical protein